MKCAKNRRIIFCSFLDIWEYVLLDIRENVEWPRFFGPPCIWVALQVFEQCCLKAGDANPLVVEPETDFNAKWPFKVIQGHLFFGIVEEPLRGFIAQYNKCCLRCEGSEDTASERSENRHF